MKKTVKSLFALVMVLALVIGSTSTVYAKPQNQGYKQMYCNNQIVDNDGHIWSIYTYDYNDYSYMGATTEIYCASLGSRFIDEDFRPSINWNKGVAGIATFKNSMINLTVAGTDSTFFNKYYTSRFNNQSCYENGPATVKGTITFDGIIHVVDCNVSQFWYDEFVYISR